MRSEYSPAGGSVSRRGGGEAAPDLSNINAWPLGEMVAEQAFATDASGTVAKPFKLPAGPYRALLETSDAFGKPVTAVLPITVLDPQANRLDIKIPQLVAAPRWSVEPGDTFTALWGTGYEEGRAFVEVEHRGKMIQSYWTRPQVTQATVEQGITEELRGGFTVHVTFVRENRAYFESRRVDVPWTNKQLTLQLGTLRLQAAARSGRVLVDQDRRTPGGEGRRRDGRGALRRVPGRLSASQLGHAAAVPFRLLHAPVQFRECGPAADECAGEFHAGLQSGRRSPIARFRRRSLDTQPQQFGMTPRPHGAWSGADDGAGHGTGEKCRHGVRGQELQSRRRRQAGRSRGGGR